MSARARLTICDGPIEFADVASTRFAEAAAAATAAHGRFAVTLSGGNTPVATYARLADPDVRARIDWNAVHVFWGDERCIPLSQPDNHFTMATELFLGKVPIPVTNVHRVETEAGDVDAAAAKCAAGLASFFALGPGQWPQFDMMILGMGADGHTASIFPGTAAVDETARLVMAHYVPAKAMNRITLTFPVLNHAHEVMFLVAGDDKAPALAAVLEGDTSLPAARVRPAHGIVHWVVDRAAAAHLGDDVRHRLTGGVRS